ncbi:hypothetical protein C8J57DRAFT_1706925 [Mycena rebaudengoi]|nr:hypothetical protein C8J57DRAFT_1706925 [Mycena rebaudengoi]
MTFFRFTHSLKCPGSTICVRRLNTRSAGAVHLRRSFLYVPSSSDPMLEKYLSSTSDTIVYDLEDSVPPAASDKAAARGRLMPAPLSAGAHIARRAVYSGLEWKPIPVEIFCGDLRSLLFPTEIFFY